MQGLLARVTKTDSWSVFDGILHHDNALIESVDKYFYEACFWSRENICQPKEAYFNPLSCYSESNSGSIVQILSKEPDMDLEAMSVIEQACLHWSKEGTTIEVYKDMIASMNEYDMDGWSAVLKAVPKEISLLCYLATKKTSNLIRTQLYAITYEIYKLLSHHSHGKYTSKLNLPSKVNETTNDETVAISDAQCHHCLREYRKYWSKEGTSNGLIEYYRVGQVLLSVAFLFDPKYVSRSTATHQKT